MWTKLINLVIDLETQTKVYPTKGNLVYEYNPFRNYRLSKNMYEYKEVCYTLEELSKDYGLTIVNDKWVNSSGIELSTAEELPILREKGELTDFVTSELKCSLLNPMTIVPLYSYDGSVNFIINDGIQMPRLINSRFSTTGRNTYLVVNRKGDNDTNIYDLGELFDIDTSLYKRVTKIPTILYLGVSAGGNMKIGNYHFYFKLTDADGNETDFIGESGLVSVFIGFGLPSSICTGTKNENSYKNVLFSIANIDTSYSYVTVYYSRYTAEASDNLVTQYAKIDRKFLVNNAGAASVVITGYEEIIDLSRLDINLNYNIVDSSKTSAVCLNMLFMANVHKPDIPYLELSDLSLRFLPYLKLNLYKLEMNEEYIPSTSNLGYFDSRFIYEKTGYWGEEIYRLGIVYIMPNNELSPVFNIRGGINIQEFKDSTIHNDGQFSEIPIFKAGTTDERLTIDYNEETNYLVGLNNIGNDSNIKKGTIAFENVKGVVTYMPTKDTDIIYSIDVRVDNDTVKELQKYVKGYFFVRQTRIPTILALGITMGIDLTSYTPCIATAGGFLEQLKDSLEKTHVTVSNINDVNYISEGFLDRYLFKFSKKSSSLWSKIGKIAAITVGVIAIAAATVFTVGAAGAILAGTASTIIGASTAGAAALGSIAGAVAGGIGLGSLGALAGTAVIVGGAAVLPTVGVAVAGAILETRYAIASTYVKKELRGRNTLAPSGYKITLTDESNRISTDFLNRFIPKDSSKVKVLGIICPDYELNLAYYNLIFTGNYHNIQLTSTLNINGLAGRTANYLSNNVNHFYVPNYYDTNIRSSYKFKIVGVPDNTKLTGIDSLKFRSRAGEAEEAWRYECVGDDYKSEQSKKNNEEDKETLSNKKINTDIIRGSFGPYLAFNDTENKFSPAETVNIYIPEYSTGQLESYISIRMLDSSVFEAISDRYNIFDIDKLLVQEPSNLVGDVDKTKGYKWDLYRGDCYLCQFTHRVNRNFNDPSAPYNDDIVDYNTWKDNYDPEDVEKYANINLGDINAVRLGMWVTFRVRSSNNLNIRTLDGSNVDETAMCGHPKAYFPYAPMSTEGTYKHSESLIYNKGFSKSLSERWNFELPDVPYIKNWFGTRIMYSDIHVNDAYKNGFRVFLSNHYRDYTREYGEIVKLISLESNLLCIFEHGIALIPVNERAVAGEGTGGNVYINTSNVLPESPKIISDMFGSQWSESVLKVPGKTGDSAQYVYGVDTVAKKIWRTDGITLTCISDFKCQEFLNNNITLGERELTPKIGIRNVKTVYNAFKRDVLFTFYDNTYGFEEKVWNLCWNELLLKFITFYSWVPSYMENINNTPFSFDRNTSKWVAKLGTSHTDNSFADGITLSNVIINNDIDENGYVVSNFSIPVSYINKLGLWITLKYKLVNKEDKRKFIGLLSLSNRVLPDSLVHYRTTFLLERDVHGSYKKFEIKGLTVLSEGYEIPGGIMLPPDAMFAGSFMPLLALFFRDEDNEYLEVYYKDGNDLHLVFDSTGGSIFWYEALNTPKALLSEMYYRNKARHAYADYDDNKIKYTKGEMDSIMDLPIFKDITGKRITLPREEMLNPDKLVTMLNIKAIISIVDEDNSTKLVDTYYNMKAGFTSGTSLIGAGYYESVVAITPKWNLLFLSTDFWKHGQAGLIDIADDIYPTYWYGRQHPFEFECIIVNDPSVHKIFTNIELVANKAKPESFHYEVIGEAYDFAKDKANMYFRLEAMKALWQYNGADISYNRNFLKILPKQQAKSADLPHKYYARQDTVNEIEDYYIHITYPQTHDYRHLSGAEIVYYPNRLEYRVWNHTMAVSLDDLDLNDSRSIISANCLYLEDRWKVTINPILVCYKNEYTLKFAGSLIQPNNSTWARALGSNLLLPTLPIYNSPIPDLVLATGDINFPGNDINNPEWGRENALFNVYDLSSYNDRGGWKPLDLSNWLNDVNIYKYNFGDALNRKEIDVRDKFVKIRVRYSGEELAVIDFLNTIYRVSYA